MNCNDCKAGACDTANSLTTQAWNALTTNGEESEEYKTAQAALDAHLAGANEPEPVQMAPEPEPEPEEEPEPVIEAEEEPQPEPEPEEAPIQMDEYVDEDAEPEPAPVVVQMVKPTLPSTVMVEANAAAVPTPKTDDLSLPSAEEIGFRDYPVPDLFDKTVETDKIYRYFENRLVGIFGKGATLLPNKWVERGIEQWMASTSDLKEFRPPTYAPGDWQLIRYLSYTPMAQTAGNLTCEVAVVVKNSENCTLGYSVTGMLRFLDASGDEIAAVPTNTFKVFKRKHTKNFNPKPEEAVEMTRNLIAEAHHVGPALPPVMEEDTGTHAYLLEEILKDNLGIPHTYLPEYLLQFRKTRQNKDPMEWSQFRCQNDGVWRSSHGIPEKLMDVYLDIQRVIWTSKGLREDNRIGLSEVVNSHFAQVSTFKALLGDS